MTTWRVRVELAPPNGAPPDSTTLARISKQLQTYDPRVVAEHDGHLAVTITIESSSRRAAFDRGDKTVTAALAAVDLGGLDVVDVGVLTTEEYERRLRQPRVPRLAGVSEAAEILGLSTARIKILADKYADRIPLVTQLAGQTGAKIWLEESWQHFNNTWDRKRTGRPPGSSRKNTEPEATD